MATKNGKAQFGFADKMASDVAEWQAEYRSMQYSRAICKLPGITQELRASIRPACAIMEEIGSKPPCNTMVIRKYTKDEIERIFNEVGRACGTL